MDRRRRPGAAVPVLREGQLLGWWDGHRRDLPWRLTRDPWAVLVAELMLQQTQVARVVDRYGLFLADFPTPAATAARPQADVVRAWQGLGYPRRARHLHRAATVAVADHGGELPADLDGLLDLPGVGPYTARAVLAFAHERDVAVVDTNVGRVLARQCGRRLGPAEAQATADRLVPTGRGWAWNQAVLDLGATVCTRRTPHCDGCPVRDTCSWRGEGEDPADGSAGVSGRQARFEGSDRQLRGRLMAALGKGPVARRDLATVCGVTDQPARARTVAAGLVSDGLVASDGDGWRLA